MSVDLETLMAPTAKVEQFMAEFLANRPFPINLRDAIGYALLGGGKRLRPLLVILSCEATGGKVDTCLPAAAAIEMVHAFSLVHDDLPAMDDDDLRRGRPTLHRHTSEPMAILAGDALLALAFEVLACRLTDAHVLSTICRELSIAANNMVAGQVYDTLPQFDEGLSDREKLEVIHEHKTGALLRASCRMGAVCGGADAAQLDAITRYADRIGLMFQIVDDLLDVTGCSEEMGKATGKDLDAGKLTYPGVLGVDKSRTEVERLRGEALAALEDFGDRANPLRDLCEYMAVRTS
ncbi:polyprenyl synthetase family protein [Mucisphaera calidilacus]|uniref:polyprenyl synthetase family protein n=1 Tax=Mucisphaera calidilacus TaxID=2527982 RepID=UPI001F33D4C9|nr:farnesyl diphosphate synthase [Mucisphaera calidilacus]